MCNVHLDSAAELSLEEQKIQAQKNQQASDGTISLPGAPDPLLLVIIGIMQSINNSQTTADIQSKILTVNANAQMSLNNQANQFEIIAITKGLAYQYKDVKVKHSKDTPGDRGFINHHVWYTHIQHKTEKLTAVENAQTTNQRNEALRDSVTNEVLLLRQNAQVGESQLNSTMNLSQQFLSEGAGVLQLLVTITNQIMQK